MEILICVGVGLFCFGIGFLIGFKSISKDLSGDLYVDISNPDKNSRFLLGIPEHAAETIPEEKYITLKVVKLNLSQK